MQRIAYALKEAGTLSSVELAAAAQISTKATVTYLNRMACQGIIRRSLTHPNGGRPTVQWFWNDAPQPRAGLERLGYRTATTDDLTDWRTACKRVGTWAERCR